MQILVTNESPLITARDMCDKHMLKLIIEATQLLSTHMYIVAPEMYERMDLYRPTHLRHPATKWLLESQNNVWWLLLCAHEMAMEYRYRYKKVHACREKILSIFAVWGDPFSTIFESQYEHRAAGHTPFKQIMPKYYTIEDHPIEAYRNYLQNEKGHFASWRAPRQRPDWWYMKSKHDDIQRLCANSVR